ncbi:MAG: sterol desaturase family protein, partial [Bacteroidota bacterium]
SPTTWHVTLREGLAFHDGMPVTAPAAVEAVSAIADEAKRLVMPPLVSGMLAFMFILLFRSTMGIEGFSVAAGFLSGYATYLSIHYATHIFKPPKNFFKKWWTFHAVHHYHDDSINFGVSTPLWDYVFGTVAKKKKKEAVAA